MNFNNNYTNNFEMTNFDNIVNLYQNTRKSNNYQDKHNCRVIAYNNNLTDDTLSDRPAIVQGDITLE